MKRSRGFTLIELMITLVLAAIILTLAVPGFQDIIRNNRAATQANELVTALGLARSEAVKRGARVSLCPSTDQASCTGGADWSNGWIVFLDTAANDLAAPVVGGGQLAAEWSCQRALPALGRCDQCCKLPAPHPGLRHRRGPQHCGQPGGPLARHQGGLLT